MTLPLGSRLGPYEIAAPIGAGGMGEVFRARDTKLSRDVAIKVLPAEFAKDHERVARFKREAQILASLNHPNIAGIFGLEEANETVALAMELVEGEDLAQRLKSGAIPVDEALAIARQIAEALEEAHEHGIIHRDLKPANVKVTPAGKVKVLDFGLAKAMEGASGSGSSAGSDSQVSNSPTMSRHATEAGLILGTAAYMSPEQARGKKVDKRADIWSFGVVLYEMLAGRRLFSGETVSDVLAAVLRADPDWSVLPAGLNAGLRRLLARCLARDPHDRYHDIADVRLALADARLPSEDTGAAVAPKLGISVARVLPWLIAAAAMLVAAFGLSRRSGGAPHSPTIFGFLVPDGRFLTRTQPPILDIARDGRTLLFVAEGKEPSAIFRRSVDRRSVQRVEGTEGAEHPVVSPDGRWIAFFAAGKLRKISIEGGAPVDVAEALAPRGVSFTPDGALVFSPNYTSGLLRVAAEGGAPVAITRLEPGKERSHRWPQALPDGRSVIFTVGAAERPGDYDGANIDAVRLDTGERKTILKGARMARYTSLGYLVFQRGETLLAAPFDLQRLEVTGGSFSILEGVAGDPPSGSGYFAVSDAGVILAAPETSIPKSRALVLVDQTGRETPLPVEAASFVHPRISPDGRRLAYVVGGGSAADDDIFILDFGTFLPRRLTFGLGHGMPIWTRDGRYITYTKGLSGSLGLGQRAADGTGEERILFRATEQMLATSWHPGGKTLLVTDAQKSIDVDLLDETGRISPVFANPQAGESMAEFSPDGRYIAYTSTETGKDEVIVETFPPGAGKWQVSAAGGAMPTWSRDGRFLYFVSGQSVFAVPVELGSEFRPGTPRVLFSGPYDMRTAIQRDYDVGPDGRFIMIKRQASSSPGEFVVLEGWEQSDPSRQRSRP